MLVGINPVVIKNGKINQFLLVFNNLQLEDMRRKDFYPHRRYLYV